MSARWLQVLSLCSFTALFAGCGDKMPSPQDMAKYSSKALGIPVFIWAQPDDACVNKQLRAFFEEYNKNTDAGKKQLVEKFKAFNAVIVQVSEDVGTIQRNTYAIDLFQKVCRAQWSPTSVNNTQSYCASEQTKIWQTADSWTSTTGRYPGTRVELGGDNDGSPRELYITPSFANDSSVSTIYKTSDTKLVSALRGSSDMYLMESAVKSKNATLVSVTHSAPVNCGKLAKLADLFGKK